MKIGYLEGLRGIAALVVVNEHLLRLFFVLAFSDSAMRSQGFGVLEEISFPPFNMLHNGAWAVCIFFVLTGYVLSNGFFSSDTVGKRDLAGKVLTRYIRLALPITACLFLVWALMPLGFDFESSVDISKAKEGGQQVEQVSILNLLKQGFWSTLFLGDFSYNPPLWTMTVELIGSMGIFFLQAVFITFRKNENAWAYRMLIYVCGILAFLPTLYVGFFLGMMLCDCKNNRRADRLLETYSKYWVPVSILMGFLLCGYMVRGLYTNPYRLVTFGGFHPYHEYWYNTWGAFFIIAAITYSKSIANFLSKPALLVLGKISFPLYLTHYILLNSLTTSLYLALPMEGHVVKAVISSLVTLPIIFLVAFIFEKTVNYPVVNFTRKIRVVLSGGS